MTFTAKSGLKGCPFCGKAPDVRGYIDGWWFARCRTTRCVQPSAMRRTESGVVAAWNRRAPNWDAK